MFVVVVVVVVVVAFREQRRTRLVGHIDIHIHDLPYNNFVPMPLVARSHWTNMERLLRLDNEVRHELDIVSIDVLDLVRCHVPRHQWYDPRRYWQRHTIDNHNCE